MSTAVAHEPIRVAGFPILASSGLRIANGAQSTLELGDIPQSEHHLAELQQRTVFSFFGPSIVLSALSAYQFYSLCWRSIGHVEPPTLQLCHSSSRRIATVSGRHAVRSARLACRPRSSQAFARCVFFCEVAFGIYKTPGLPCLSHCCERALYNRIICSLAS